MFKKLLNDPAFFDIFGILTFGFITIISAKNILTGVPIPKTSAAVLLLIGIAGLIVDGRIVWRRFIKKDSG